MQVPSPGLYLRGMGQAICYPPAWVLGVLGLVIAACCPYEACSYILDVYVALEEWRGVVLHLGVQALRVCHTNQDFEYLTKEILYCSDPLPCAGTRCIGHPYAW